MVLDRAPQVDLVVIVRMEGMLTTVVFSREADGFSDRNHALRGAGCLVAPPDHDAFDEVALTTEDHPTCGKDPIEDCLDGCDAEL
jgi:hypothetical protein